MDTKSFKELSPEEYKQQTQSNWSSAPCGSNYAQSEFLSKDFFNEVEQHRYSTHPWILENIRNFNIQGKDVLEIGYGMGTDHMSLARQGANLFGIDLTPRHMEICSKRFDLFNMKTRLMLGDAENLPFNDDSFDFVYSFGVVHHTPDTERIISEIHRVLKPGGRCHITVYHRNSLFFWWSVFFHSWILGLDFLHESIQQRISKIEYPNDNPNLVIRLYRKKEFAALFNAFSDVSARIDHLTEECVDRIGKYLPASFFRKYASRFGWYVIIDAVK